MIYAEPDELTLAVAAGVPAAATLGVKVIDSEGEEVVEHTTDVVELVEDSGVWAYEFEAPEEEGTFRILWDTGDDDPVFVSEDLLVSAAAPPGVDLGAAFNPGLEGAPTDLVGTLGVQIVEPDGTVHTARTTDDIVEVEEDSGIYSAPELLAPTEPGNYVVLWDADDIFTGEALRVTVHPSYPWRPSVSEVAKELRARTKDGEEEAGTFTATTRPTEAQVEGHIDEAASDVTALFAAGSVPLTSYDPARRLAIYKAAMTIEASYQPEQAEDAPDSLYRHLSRMQDGALARLVNGANVRDLFAEAADS